MAKIVVSRHYDAPLSRVFEVYSDIDNCAGRIPAILKIEPLTDLPFGVGYRWRETRVMFKKEATEEMEVVAFEPNRRYLVEAFNCGCRYETEFNFREEEGGTTVERSFSATPLTFMAKVMSPVGFLFKGMIRKCFKDDMDALAGVIEGEPGVEVATM